VGGHNKDQVIENLHSFQLPIEFIAMKEIIVTDAVSSMNYYMNDNNKRKKSDHFWPYEKIKTSDN